MLWKTACFHSISSMTNHSPVDKGDTRKAILYIWSQVLDINYMEFLLMNFYKTTLNYIWKPVFSNNTNWNVFSEVLVKYLKKYFYFYKTKIIHWLSWFNKA